MLGRMTHAYTLINQPSSRAKFSMARDLVIREKRVIEYAR